MATGKICAVEGCTNILNKTAGRICQMHRTRFFRHGSYDFVSPNWTGLKKGQPHLTNLGYLRITINGKRVLHHRYIMEQYLGRELTKDERIHHKNGIKTDNRIENLELHKNNSEHMKSHHRYSWKNRRIHSIYSPDEISNVMQRLSQPIRTYNNCFCGNPVDSRNLCTKHHHWAWEHKFT